MTPDKKLHPIMFAGTGSDVGKSVIAAAFCRIFRQDGYHPAPFKAQNMALNSYATPEGLEIGRAQAVQAEAAGIPCHSDMNPLLLKPSSDHTSQVVLHGKPIGNRDAYDFWRRLSPAFTTTERQSAQNSPLFAATEPQPTQNCGSVQAAAPSQQPAGPSIDFRAEVCAAYDRLALKYSPIVMEGAGSISELNLRDTDLVNLPMARHADAAVILVADIDRGGVFASVYGSIALQTPEDRALIKGIIINKFRGDLRLFDDGRRMLEDICGVPVLGVVPYYKDIHIDEEDSVALSEKLKVKSEKFATAKISIAVVLLRHISNFTDFDTLERDPRINLFYTNNVQDLQRADIIILPGTKSTLDDLLELRRNGCAQAILRAHRDGKTVVGICGGYQMMGVEVFDPDHVEGEQERLPGLGLLPVATTMNAEKVTRQVTFRLAFTERRPTQNGETDREEGTPAPVACRPSLREGKAYEIHNGETAPIADAQPSPLAILDDGRQDGYLASPRCMGTYLHGILDNPSFVDFLLQPLAEKFAAPARPFDHAAFKEEQYDRLAAHVRQYVDIPRIYQILTS